MTEIVVAVLFVILGFYCLVQMSTMMSRQIENANKQIDILRTDNGELMKQIGLLTEASVKRMPARTVEYLEHSQYEVFALMEDLERAKIAKQGEIDRIQAEQDRMHKIFDYLKTARTANNNRKEKV